MTKRAFPVLVVLAIALGFVIAQARSEQSAESGAPAACHPIRPNEIEMLEKAGLSDPIRQVVESLQAHPELVAEFAVGGSVMGFYFPEQIHVLNHRWVYAYFEDGHTSGYGVFEYSIEPDTTLSWKVLFAKPVQALGH
jgi:hypothetical protein